MTEKEYQKLIAEARAEMTPEWYAELDRKAREKADEYYKNKKR